MKIRKLYLLIIMSVLVLLQACKSDKVIEQADSSRRSLDWTGYYQGLILQGDNEGTYIDLELHEDSTFVKREKKLNSEDKLIAINGTFSWSEDGNDIILTSDFEAYNSILKVEKQHLIWKKRQNENILAEKSNDYILTKIPGLLLEREWVITSIANIDVHLSPKGNNEHINIFFASDENKAYGFGGCNFYRTSYHLIDNELAFTPIMATKMAGPNINIENKFFANLQKVKKYQIVDKELYLSDENGLNIIKAKLKEARK